MHPDEVAAELAARFASAWNRHDMGELASLFDDDASFVNVAGMRMRGREAIRQAHASVHAGIYRDSHVLVEVDDARELAPNVIVAALRTELIGDERAPGEVRYSLLTLVIDRHGDDWAIAAAQNTHVVTPPPDR